MPAQLLPRPLFRKRPVHGLGEPGDRRAEALAVGIGQPVQLARLAEKTGIPQNHISTIERGAKLPTLGTLIRFAAALECKVSTLVRVFDKEDLGALLPK